MKKTRLIATILCLALLLSSLSACGGSSKPAESGDAAGEPNTSNGTVTEVTEPEKTTAKKLTPEGTFVFGMDKEPANLDPMNSMPICQPFLWAMYDRLIIYDAETDTYLPSIATEWDWEDDLTLHLTIRDDICFHNGEKLTAEDVLFSFSRFTESKFRSEYVDSFDFENSAVTSDTTLTLKFTQPYAPAMKFLASAYGSIVCKSYVEANGEDALTFSGMGTGRFKFGDWISGDSITMTRNEDYWGEGAKYDTLKVRFITEDASRFIEFQTGGLDAMIGLSANDIDTLSSGGVSGASCVKVESSTIQCFILKDTNEALADIRVRQAIAHAIDMEALVANVYGSGGVLAKGYLPSTVMGYKDVGTYEYDPELSKQLLAEAGYGDGLTLAAAASTSNVDKEAMVILQNYLNEVGITLQVEIVDNSTQIQYQTTGVIDVGKSQNLCTSGDVFELFSAMTNATNQVSGTSDQTLLGMINAASGEMDNAARSQDYEEIQQYIYDNVTAIPIAQLVYCYAVWDYVGNFTGSPAGYCDLCDIII